MKKMNRSIMSSAVTFHKTERTCIRGIVCKDDNLRFVPVGEDFCVGDDCDAFEFCPVCGKEIAENKIGV